MTLPAIDTLAGSLGGALFDYDIPILDPTTDRPASAVNKAYANLSGGSRTAIRAWAEIAFTQGAWGIRAFGQDAVWGKATGVAPGAALFGTGVFLVGWPLSVSDEIPQGSPGASAAHSIAASPRTSWGRVTGGATYSRVWVQPLGSAEYVANVYNVSGSLTTPPTDAKISLFWF